MVTDFLLQSLQSYVRLISDNDCSMECLYLETGKASGPLDVSLYVIVDSEKVWIQVVFWLCHRVFNILCIPDESALCAMVQIFKQMVDMMNCGSNRTMNLLENCMKVMKRVLEKHFMAYSVLTKCSLALCL